MAHHVQNHAAAVFFAVVPARALDGLQIAFKHPVAKLQPHAQHLAEKACAPQHVELAQTGQKQLVLHRAVFKARGSRHAGNLNRLVQVGGNRLFTIHMFAGADGLGQQGRAHLRGTRIEENRVAFIGQCRINISAPAADAVSFCQRFNLFSIAANQYRVGHDFAAVRQRDAALLANGDDGADQVLVHAHAPGDAVHDDAE